MKPLLICLLAVPAFCQPSPDPQAILKRAFDVTGFSAHKDQILHWHDMQGVEQDYQSEPPYLTALQSREVWIDLKTGYERIAAQTIFPSFGPTPVATSFASQHAVFRIGSTGPARDDAFFLPYRNVDLWAILADWRNAADVHAAPAQSFQDYPRLVLAREGMYGEERLFLDPKTGFPVKLDREEPHYLWGQNHVEYIYSNYVLNDGAFVPGSSARVVDGFKETTRTVGTIEFLDRDKAPSMDAPAGIDQPGETLSGFLQPLPPTKVDVTPHVFLTRNRGYTEGFALAGDTIFVLEATQSEKRAQQDLEMIQKTFPGKHPIVLIVGDDAWPHVGGVRFWVASGATVVAHRAQREFLTKVIQRRWTRTPDLLERNRKNVKLHFVSVDKIHDMAGGKVRIAAIDGIGSEKALMTYLPDEKFLWANDYIQDIQRNSAYASEVAQAVHREKFTPEKVAAMHIPLTDWSAIEHLVEPATKPAKTL